MAGLQFVPPHPIALRTIAQGPPYRKSDEGVSGVPRYFVEFTNGPHTLADTEGVDLADLRAARECAIEDARFLIESARPPAGDDGASRFSTKVASYSSPSHSRRYGRIEVGTAFRPRRHNPARHELCPAQ